MNHTFARGAPPHSRAFLRLFVCRWLSLRGVEFALVITISVESFCTRDVLLSGSPVAHTLPSLPVTSFAMSICCLDFPSLSLLVQVHDLAIVGEG